MQTWHFCLDILKDKALRGLAAQNGADFVRFLRAFKDMRAGFALGNFVYGLMGGEGDSGAGVRPAQFGEERLAAVVDEVHRFQPSGAARRDQIYVVRVHFIRHVA